MPLSKKKIEDFMVGRSNPSTQADTLLFLFICIQPYLKMYWWEKTNISDAIISLFS